MPELPEVETVRRQLEKNVKGKTVSGIVSRHKKTVSGGVDRAKGKKVTGTSRYGKMLVLDLAGGLHIGIHLKMSGQLIYSSLYEPGNGGEELPGKHTRAVIEFTDGTNLYFNDQRIFGWVKVLDDGEMRGLSFVKKLGPEVWDITDKDFFEKTRTRNKAIKLTVLDQEIISGVGNIYANDSLWEARIHPERKAKDLTEKEAAALRQAMVTVLREAIRFRGSSGRDQKYVMIDGSGGRYQEHFRVYDREGEQCLRKDGGVIEKIQLGGRGTYFCPECQK